MKFKNIFFDLDGTIIKSEDGIIKSIKLSLDKLGINEYDENILMDFIGPPLYDSYKKYFNISDKEYEIALDEFHDYYKNKGIFECELYKGIKECIKELKDNAYRIYLATSKPEIEAKRIMKYFELDSYFDFICGQDGDHNTKRGSKSAVIKHIIDECELETSSVLMIGDRKNDINGAKSCNISSMGVLYGYGTYEELVLAKSDYIVEKTNDICKTIYEINGRRL